MTHAEYVEREFRKALEAGAGGPVETVRVKAEGPTGSSRRVSLTVPEFEALIGGTVAKVAERGDA